MNRLFFVPLVGLLGCLSSGGLGGAPYSGASADCAEAAGIAYELCTDVTQDESAIEAECDAMDDSDCWRACVEQAADCDEALACQDACGA